jgi:hypothetical protein
MRTEARFGGVEPAAGHYESFFIKAARPGGGQGVWIRHTVHKRPGAEPTASVWLTFFDAQAGAPRAAKATFASADLGAGEGDYIRISETRLTPGRASGSVTTDSLAASWELDFEDRHDALRHLPRAWMYSSKRPRTKLLSPHPGAIFDGRLTIGDTEISLEQWPGVVGHNWGTEHAERWIWIHGAGFEDRGPDEYIDISVGRINVSRFTTPWIANGRIALDGEELQLGGLGHIYGTEITESPTGCEFVLPGKNVNVRGRVAAPPERFVGWAYADPAGPDHQVLNCSIADLELKVERPAKRHAHLRLPGGATYEIGMRETDHGIPIQAAPDG